MLISARDGPPLSYTQPLGMHGCPQDYVNGGELFYHLRKERRFGEDKVRFYASEVSLLSMPSFYYLNNKVARQAADGV